MAHRVSPQALSDLENIWYYVATESSSVDPANRLIEEITSRFLLLSKHPHLGRSRTDDFGIDVRSIAVGDYVIIYSVEENDVQVLRVVHGRRDLEALFED